MKIRTVGVELYHADRQADKHDANNRFSQFCERRLIILLSDHLLYLYVACGSEKKQLFLHITLTDWFL